MFTPNSSSSVRGNRHFLAKAWGVVDLGAHRRPTGQPLSPLAVLSLTADLLARATGPRLLLAASPHRSGATDWWGATGRSICDNRFRIGAWGVKRCAHPRS